MNQQGQQYTPARRTGGYNDELHMGGSSSISQQSQSSSTSAPQIKLDQASPGHQPQLQSYQSSSAVPGVLQPGRPPVMSSNAASTVPPMQQPEHRSEYTTPSKPTLSTHSYSRSSPAANPYDGTSYVPYTPTTPNTGLSSQQFMTPGENKYASGGQRNVSNTPLGLADIRPRADSSLSEGLPGSMQYELANGQPGTSNYLAPWASYAFDWCKWAPQGNSSGKLAIGSYLEDGHNFVRTHGRLSHDLLLSGGGLTRRRLCMCRYKSLIPRSHQHQPMYSSPTPRNTRWSSPRLPRPHTRTRLLVCSGSPLRPRSSRPTSWPLLAITYGCGLCRPRRLLRIQTRLQEGVGGKRQWPS